MSTWFQYDNQINPLSREINSYLPFNKDLLFQIEFFPLRVAQVVEEL